MPHLLDFFKNKNRNRKFSELGEGHRLPDIDPPSQHVPTPSTSSTRVPVAESSKVAEAAMKRLNNQFKKPETAAHREVRRELEAKMLQEKEARELQERLTQEVVVVERPSVLSEVLFWCPSLLGESVIGSRDQVDKAIQECLVTESGTNPMEAASLLLSRGLQLTRPPPVAADTQASVQPTIGEWMEKQRRHFVQLLDNLIREPERETFRRLRADNRLVKQLLSIEGATAFLAACKFTEKKVPSNSPPTTAREESPSSVVKGQASPRFEVYWSISEVDARCTGHLEMMRELLLTADPILPELYRDTKVFQVTGSVPVSLTRDQLPDEFFCISKEEFARLLEQQRKYVSESGMLLTKSMRKQLKMQNHMLFRYVLLRVRLPGNHIIQGTFSAKDTLFTVRSWVSECLAEPTTEYQLWSPPGIVSQSRPNLPPSARVELTEDAASIVDLGLAPCSLLTLVLTPGGKPVAQQQRPTCLLRPDLVAKMTTLPPGT